MGLGIKSIRCNVNVIECIKEKFWGEKTNMFQKFRLIEITTKRNRGSNNSYNKFHKLLATRNIPNDLITAIIWFKQFQERKNALRLKFQMNSLLFSLVFPKQNIEVKFELLFTQVLKLKWL